MFLRILLLGSVFLPLTFVRSHADEKWCVEDLRLPPCHGAPGRCTTNKNGSRGGFVADSADVAMTSSNGVVKNIPFLGQYTQVCDSASVKGEARIMDRAVISGNAKISGSAQIFGHAQVYEDAYVYGNAQVFEYACLSGQSRVYGRARVFGDARVYGGAHVNSDAQASEDARVYGNAEVSDNAHVSGYGRVFENAHLYGNVQVYEVARVLGNAHAFGYSEISGHARVLGDARVSGHAQILGSASLLGSTCAFGNARVDRGVIHQGTFGAENDSYVEEEWLNLPPGPAAALILPTERPPSAYATGYSGSEAEVYRTYLDQRHHRQADFHRMVDVLGERVDANSYNYDGTDAFEVGYEIKNVNLANILSSALGREIKRGTVIREGEVLANETVANAIASSSEEDYHRNPYAFPAVTASEPFPLRDEVNQYLDFIRKTILNHIEELNRLESNQTFEIYYQDSQRRREAGERETYLLRYFHNPHYPSNGGIYIHDRLHPAYKFTGALFFKVMDAIKENDERNFLVHMINLATAFHPSRLEARNGLIEALTYLYVAKRFPNRLVRQRYFHFTLNCGGIY